MIQIPRALLAYAAATYPHLVPHQRIAGFDDATPEERGKGDYMDLLGSLMLFHVLGERNRVCTINITCGTGDSSDNLIRVRNQWMSVNVKTSSYAPFSERLHLYVKEEEIAKPIDIYIQVFVHTREGGLAPHVHFAGYVARGSSLWTSVPIAPIPRTNHRGIGIPVSALEPVENLIEMSDQKF